MTEFDEWEIVDLYRMLESPITIFDCGEKCGVYNENHIPFCCDTRHIIPMAYDAEWHYLRNNTDLWHLYSGKSKSNPYKDKIPEDQVLIECLGYQKCQRDFRSISCRAFPFYPYIAPKGEFIGLTVYWEYEDRCWLINHLDFVTPLYRDEFISAFDYILTHSSREYAIFRQQSINMRRVFSRKKRAIPLISRAITPQIKFYRVSPHNGRMRLVCANSFVKHGIYYFADKIPYEEEI